MIILGLYYVPIIPLLQGGGGGGPPKIWEYVRVSLFGAHL